MCRSIALRKRGRRRERCAACRASDQRARESDRSADSGTAREARRRSRRPLFRSRHLLRAGCQIRSSLWAGRATEYSFRSRANRRRPVRQDPSRARYSSPGLRRRIRGRACRGCFQRRAMWAKRGARAWSRGSAEMSRRKQARLCRRNAWSQDGWWRRRKALPGETKSFRDCISAGPGPDGRGPEGSLRRNRHPR